MVTHTLISTSTILPWDWRGGKYSPVSCTRDSAHKTFGPTDLTSMYSVCTRRVFGGIGHWTQGFRSGVYCSNHQATHDPITHLITECPSPSFDALRQLGHSYSDTFLKNEISILIRTLTVMIRT
ncbi:hypothetical protein TNCV_3595121 [Trichonephila clavipes]|nr:hypothetical protein TNCV_3595121 [Trichonephila clavipes]